MLHIPWMGNWAHIALYCGVCFGILSSVTFGSFDWGVYRLDFSFDHTTTEHCNKCTIRFRIIHVIARVF